VAAERLGVTRPTCGSGDGVVHGIAFRASGWPGRTSSAGLLPAGPAVGRRLLPHRGPALGLLADAGRALQVLRLRRGRARGGGRRVHGAYRTRRVDIVHDVGRQPVAAGRPRPDRGRASSRAPAGSPSRTCAGTRATGPPRAAAHAGGQHLQAAELLGDAGALHVELLQDAAEDGVVYGSKGVGEPPLMLAFSVREALRQAAAAFGPPGTSVDLPSPATPRPSTGRSSGRVARRTVSRGGTGVEPPQPAPGAPRSVPAPSRRQSLAGLSAGVDWLRAVDALRTGAKPGGAR
jgi:xanthine dehydrogenase large subunit